MTMRKIPTAVALEQELNCFAGSLAGFYLWQAFVEVVVKKESVVSVIRGFAWNGDEAVSILAQYFVLVTFAKRVDYQLYRKCKDWKRHSSTRATVADYWRQVERLCQEVNANK